MATYQNTLIELSAHSSGKSTKQGNPTLACAAVTADRGRRESKQRPTNSSISPGFFMGCASHLGEAFQHIFNLSMRLHRLLIMWKSSCLVPVAKNGHTWILNDYRPDPLWDAPWTPSSSHTRPTKRWMMLSSTCYSVHISMWSSTVVRSESHAQWHLQWFQHHKASRTARNSQKYARESPAGFWISSAP